MAVPLSSLDFIPSDPTSAIGTIPPLTRLRHFGYILLLLCLYIACKISKRSRWNARHSQSVDFATAHGCAQPPTIDGSLLQGILHKWKRLNEKGDIFNDYMYGVFRDNGPTHAIMNTSTGDVKTIYTIEPANIRAMLSLNFSHYHRPKTMPNALDPVMGQGVFTSNGAAWAHSRGLVKAQFSTKRIRDIAKLERHIQNIFEALGDITTGHWTDEQSILPIFNHFTLDTATEFMFGTSAESHEAAMVERRLVTQQQHQPKSILLSLIRKAFAYLIPLSPTSDFGTAFDLALDYVALRLKLGKLYFLADGLSFRFACYKVQSFADNYIREATTHATRATESKPIRESLAIETDALDHQKYGLISELVHSYPDKVALRNQVMQLLVAGRDTTAATLAWTFALLEAHPQVFDKLQRTVVDTFGTEVSPRANVTFDNLRACTYLQWVIFEVVRLYPTGPLNARKASCDTVLPVGGGLDGKSPVAVKAGATVAYNTYLIHRRTDIWGEDAWSFCPERWAVRKIGWEYVPFHGGPQTCLGPKCHRTLLLQFCD